MIAKAAQEATQGPRGVVVEHGEVPREQVVELLLPLLWDEFGA